MSDLLEILNKLLPVFVWPLGIITFLVLDTMGFEIIRERLKKREFKDSVNEGAEDEPRAIRELTADEQKILFSKRRWSGIVLNHIWWLAILFSVFDIILILKLIDKFAFLGDPILVSTFAIVLAVQWVIISVALAESKHYFDLRSPVYRVQGKVLLGLLLPQSSKSIEIRGVKFDIASISGLVDKIQGGYFKNGDEVVVEYSPRTKHVWKLNKAEN